MKMGMLHEELSGKIIGAAMSVLNTLKPGLDEMLYENGLVLEFQHIGLEVEQQKQYPIEYRGQRIGNLIPDLIVDQKVIVDTKVVKAFDDNHICQMTGYLAITGLDLALLMNFKYAKLQWKRVAHSEPIRDKPRDPRQDQEPTADGADGRGSSPNPIRDNPRNPRSIS